MRLPLGSVIKKIWVSYSRDSDVKLLINEGGPAGVERRGGGAVGGVERAGGGWGRRGQLVGWWVGVSVRA